MKIVTALAMVAGLMLLVAGCGTVPRSPVCTWNLNGDHLIYFEQCDRVPKDVMIDAIKSQNVHTTIMASAQFTLSPEIIAAIVKQLLTAIPEMSKIYSSERMNEALIIRRIIIRGYEGTNELAEVNEIIKSLNDCMEKWTQPNE